MPIISKETWTPWELIPKEVQNSLISDYKALLTSPNKKERDWAKGLEVIFGKENLQPQPLTYEDVARELFEKSGLITYGVGEEGGIFYFNWSSRYDYIKSNQPNLCTSRKQAEKLLAINRLLNVAKFLNGKDWKPDFSDYDKEFWYFEITPKNQLIVANGGHNSRPVYFRTEELANMAAAILGEDVIRFALSSDW